MSTQVACTETTKGHRVWLQGVHNQPTLRHRRYTVVYTADAIILCFGPEGKRKVTDSKGGIIDLQSSKVTQWAQGATQVQVWYGPDVVHIVRTTAA